MKRTIGRIFAFFDSFLGYSLAWRLYKKQSFSSFSSFSRERKGHD